MKKSSLEKLLQVHAELYDPKKKELIREVIVDECGEKEPTFKNALKEEKDV